MSTRYVDGARAERFNPGNERAGTERKRATHPADIFDDDRWRRGCFEHVLDRFANGRHLAHARLASVQAVQRGVNDRQSGTQTDDTESSLRGGYRDDWQRG